MRAQGLSKKLALDKMLEWNDKMLNGYFPTHAIIRQVNSAYDPSKERFAGCTYAKGLLREVGKLSVCKGCPREKKRVNNDMEKRTHKGAT